MLSAYNQGPRRSPATRFCGFLLFLLLSSLLTNNAFARDSTSTNADAAGGGISTPKIDFIGNKAFSSGTLREALSKGGPQWFAPSGSIRPDALYKVTDFLTAFYYDNGFLNVQVDQPQIASADRAMIAIDEGHLYRVGSIAIEGRLRFPHREVESQLTMRTGQPFRGSTLQRNVLALADFYSDRGFAYVIIDPRTKLDSKRHLVDVNVLITPGDETRIDQITISGNTTTPEQVIRAALRFHEHELYSARAFRESMARLEALGLKPHITTLPSTKPDEINVKVTVVEKTGNLKH